MATFITNIQFSRQGVKDLDRTTIGRAFTAAESDRFVRKVHRG